MKMDHIDREMRFLLYHDAEDDVAVNAAVLNESIWVTQKAMAELFDVDVSTISRHLKNIFDEQELDEEVVIAKIATTTQHGAISGKTQTRETNFYNLDAIISVGYRVNSRRATRFRIWATGILKEYMIKGFAMDDERLKQGEAVFGRDYFRELLERVRSIRASERRVGSKSQIFLRSAALTMTKILRLRMNFMQQCRTSFTMLSQDRPQLRLCIPLLITPRNTWDLLHGRMRRMDVF